MRLDFSLGRFSVFLAVDAVLINEVKVLGTLFFRIVFSGFVFELLKGLKSLCFSAAAAGLHHTKDVQWFESCCCFPWTEEDGRKCLRFHQGDLGRSLDFRFFQFC